MGKLSVREHLESDYELRSLDSVCVNTSTVVHKWYHNLRYSVAGALFGLALVKGEVVSWFRIQEMFRLQSFHMYGVIGSAVLAGMVSVWLIKRLRIKTMDGEDVTFPSKRFSKGQVYGGVIFGFGWALTGACPGPLFAQIGTGAFVSAVTLAAAISGHGYTGSCVKNCPTSLSECD